MNVWLDNIWKWIISNKDEVMAFLTSSTFATMIVTVITIIKNIKSTRKNTLSIDSINDTFKTHQTIHKDVTSIKDETSEIRSVLDNTAKDVHMLETKLDIFAEKFDRFNSEVIEKFNAVLEVQSIVYATIKDDNIRDVVNSILVSAKHCDVSSKIKLQNELDEIKSELAAKKAELDDTVSRIMDKMSAEVTAIPKSDEAKNKVISRY